MAWNLGNTKVFCPVSVDFFKADNQDKRNEMSEKYLVIDSKYEKLLEIGKQINDKILIKENSRILAFYGNEFNADYLDLLKTHCNHEEW